MAQQLAQSYFEQVQEAGRTIFELQTQVAEQQTRSAERDAQFDLLTQKLTEAERKIVELATALKEARESAPAAGAVNSKSEPKAEGTSSRVGSAAIIKQADRNAFIQNVTVITDRDSNRGVVLYEGTDTPKIFAKLFDRFFAALEEGGVVDFSVLSQTEAHVKTPYCIRQRLIHGTTDTDWHRGKGGVYACKECVSLGLPCFKAFNTTERTSVVYLLPLCPLDRCSDGSFSKLNHSKWATPDGYRPMSSPGSQRRSGPGAEKVVNEDEAGKKRKIGE